MVSEHVQVLHVGDRVLIASQAGKHQSHPSEVFEHMGTHVTFDMNQVIVHLDKQRVY
jgi:hypothetical protein